MGRTAETKDGRYLSLFGRNMDVSQKGTKLYQHIENAFINLEKARNGKEEAQGRNRGEYWLTCFEIMSQYGLGKTQVRRFAETHGVRIRKTKAARQKRGNIK